MTTRRKPSGGIRGDSSSQKHIHITTSYTENYFFVPVTSQLQFFMLLLLRDPEYHRLQLFAESLLRLFFFFFFFCVGWSKPSFAANKCDPPHPTDNEGKEVPSARYLGHYFFSS